MEDLCMLRFLIHFLKDPKNIGAVAPSGKFLAEKMMKSIQFDNAKCIVEYGPGTGSFTKEIIKRKKKETILILIETDKLFCMQLNDEFGKYDNVYIVNDSAENINKYMEQYGITSVDYIVSGLPFTLLPLKVSENIFKSTIKAISEQGYFITFQYSMVKKKLFEQYFKLVGRYFEFRNLPPAYIIVMKSKIKKG